MAVQSISGVNTQIGQMGVQTTDSYTRNLQNQIANAQRELQELSTNKEMTDEEKMKKRQELQQQINDWNIQLRQHQMELRKERQQEASASMEDMLGGTKRTERAESDGGSVEISQAGMDASAMHAMISADSSMKQAKVQGSVATKLKGKANVLESEMKQDAGRGASVEKKQEELAALEQKAQAATASQLTVLADANRTMAGAAKENQTTEETEGKVSEAEDAENLSESEEQVAYVPVDIRL